MKTNHKKSNRAQEQIRTVEQHRQQHRSASAVAQKPDNRLPIDTEARKKNRTLPTPKVLELLKTSNPGLFNLAEVVGKWVWVDVPRDARAGVAADFGAAWFPLES